MGWVKVTVGFTANMGAEPSGAKKKLPKATVRGGTSCSLVVGRGRGRERDRERAGKQGKPEAQDKVAVFLNQKVRESQTRGCLDFHEPMLQHECQGDVLELAA